MNIYTLIGVLRDAIHDDSALQTWCTTNYGKNQAVYVGIDQRNPPKTDIYPVISINPESKGQGLSVEKMRHAISVNCAIENGDSRTIAGKANIVEMAGVYDLSYFTAAVFDIIAEAVPAGLFLESATTEWDDIHIFPEFITRSTLQINEPQHQGGDSFD